MSFLARMVFVAPVVASVFGYALVASAATIFATPASTEISIGEDFTIELRVDSAGASFNAAQAAIRFPQETLEVLALDATSSVLNFWLEEPQFSNADGVITFAGGTPYGVSGSAVSVLKVTFRAKGSGSATVTFTEAAISAADGSGTNILSTMNNAVVVIVPKQVTPEPPVPRPKPIEPVKKTSVAAPVIPLPPVPVLSVPLYPEKDRWYNFVSPFSVHWVLPPGVSGVHTALNTEPRALPKATVAGLFESKTFPALTDGVQYLHVRFQNTTGWGPAAHYKIAVDTVPPLGFDVRVREGEATDTPTPTLEFKTSDALSGLREYQVRVDGGELMHIPVALFTGIVTLPIQTPGEKHVLIRALDQAGNGVETSSSIDILPIASPVITFVPQELFSDAEEGLVVKGTALQNVTLLLKVQKVATKGGGEILAEGSTRADDRGNWSFTFADQSLRNGRYVILAEAEDARGALSLRVVSPEIRVRSTPIIQIGTFALDAGGAILSLLVILCGSFVGGVWFYKKEQLKRAFRVDFAGAEIAKIFALITRDVETLDTALRTPSQSDDAYAFRRLRDNIKKMGSYLRRGVEKIKR